MKPAIVVILSLALFFILRTSFPKYTGMLGFLLFYLILNAYLWIWVKEQLKTLIGFFRALLSLLFWLPVLLLICLIIYGFILPFTLWSVILKTEAVSLFLIAFLSTFFPITGMLLSDLIRIIFWGFYKASGKSGKAFLTLSRNKWVMLTSFCLGAGLFLILLAGMIFWKYDFRVREQHVRLPSLPEPFVGLKIVQISDIHLGSWLSKEKLKEAAARINTLNPDVIFFTGDMFNYSTADGDGFQEILQQLYAPMGVFAILGNHDYGDYMSWPNPEAKVKNMQDLETWYKTLGWKLLRNENIILHKSNDSIALIGVENWGSTRRFQRLGDIEKAQKGTEKMEIQLLLSHDPTHWDRIISQKYPHIDLTFAGHTHGGQFGFDFPGLHWSPVSWIYEQWCGLYRNPHGRQPQYLYVNQGLGTIGYSGRAGIPPEISLVVLEQ